ncbi:hypothetical protein K2P47_03885 [Patescibacteria group bacterium]|nr:hypothetical protein [Patescibacteria group bacterium]
MNPNSQTKNIKLMQYLTTLLLVLILIAMIAGYIYYGMYTARQNAVEVESMPITTDTTDTDDAKRAEIINALSQEAPTISDERKNDIVESLTTQSDEQFSPEAQQKRQEIIEALQQN